MHPPKIQVFCSLRFPFDVVDSSRSQVVVTCLTIIQLAIRGFGMLDHAVGELVGISLLSDVQHFTDS